MPIEHFTFDGKKSNGVNDESQVSHKDIHGKMKVTSAAVWIRFVPSVLCLIIERNEKEMNKSNATYLPST